MCNSASYLVPTRKDVWDGCLLLWHRGPGNAFFVARGPNLSSLADNRFVASFPLFGHFNKGYNLFIPFSFHDTRYKINSHSSENNRLQSISVAQRPVAISISFYSVGGLVCWPRRLPPRAPLPSITASNPPKAGYEHTRQDGIISN